MAEKDESPAASSSSPSSLSSPLKLSSGSNRPTITLPPRTTMDTLFAGGMGFSPGPMTLVSSFFSETDPDSEYRSFSQLLAGSIASPAAVATTATAAAIATAATATAATATATATAAASGLKGSFAVEEEARSGGGGGGGGSGDYGFRFQQNRPTGLVVGQSPMFTIPAGLSPACLLDSPVLFSSAQGGFGMSHQQALAQVTAQAAQNHSQIHPQPPQAEYRSILPAQHDVSFTQPTSLTANASTHEQMPRLESVPKITMNESSEFSNSDQRSYSSTIIADKPADDGYNWRKYGQKHVKGSEFPRSYYKCTHPNCPVTKKVERSLEGHVTEIIYKGQHSHQKPQSTKRTKGAGQSNGSTVAQGHPELASQVHNSNLNKQKGVTACSSKKDQEYSQNTSDHTGSSDNEEGGDAEIRMDHRAEEEPDPKRRISEVKASEPVCTHKTVTEPRIIVQTTSEVDLLDDGYRWRKYGQKVVKGNPYPRSYYKCTTPACNVRKHIERAASDPKAVITTYEGKHNHDVPASRNSSHNTSHSNSSHGTVATTEKRMNLGNNDQMPVAVLQLKEEQIT